MSKIPSALTIAGSDPSGGAGIQADLKTFQEHQTYGMSVITSLTAQNTTGVQGLHHVPIEMIQQQLDSVINDIDIHAFKTGMLATVDVMQVVKEYVPKINAPFVMDPVMIAASGDPLIAEEAREYLKKNLLPLTTVVTPNVPEAEVITGIKIESLKDMEQAAKVIVEEFGATSALVKGGHLGSEAQAIDVFVKDGEVHHFSSERIDTKNSHGTGCTLSAAITAYIANDHALVEAIEHGKHYITKAIQHSLDIGSGSGPTNHWAPRIKKEDSYD
jgi:hydroxymethylpyrimidine/phosphomethylpyrimidine kinase